MILTYGSSLIINPKYVQFMKKTLLSLVALMATTAGFAQSKAQAVQSFSKKVSDNKSLMAPVKHQVGMADAAQPVQRRGQAEGVFYARPEGTYWLGNSTAKYLVVPPFTDVKFINMSNDPSVGSWALGTSDLSEYADENNDLVFSFDKVTPGYVMYSPILTSGNQTYQIADNIMVVDSVAQMLFPFNYTNAPRYYGYSDGASAFMSGADAFDFDGDGTADTFYPEFRQYFEKPATSLALSEVLLWVTSKDKNFTGSTLSLVFNKVQRDENGRRILGDEIATMKCVAANMDTETISAKAQVYPGDLTFANMVTDEFETEEAVPVLLNEEFAITIKGTTDPNIDVRFYFCDQGEYPEEWYTRATPTYIVPFDANGNSLIRPDGNPNGLSYYNNTEQSGPYCYNISFIFFGEMDGINVVTNNDLNKQIAPVAGGETGCAPFTSSTGVVDGYPAYVYTNYPFFEQDGEEYYDTDNYSFEGIPEWAAVKIDPSGYEYEIGTDNEIRGLHMIWFECDALPAGETGRSAAVYVKSRFGMTSADPIYIIQGDAEISGVKAIKFDANGKFVGTTFNIAGQKVNDNAKGLVIKDGKKFFVK